MVVSMLGLFESKDPARVPAGFVIRLHEAESLAFFKGGLNDEGTTTT